MLAQGADRPGASSSILEPLLLNDNDDLRDSVMFRPRPLSGQHAWHPGAGDSGR